MNDSTLYRNIDPMIAQDESDRMVSAEALAQSAPSWEGIEVFDDVLGDSVWVPSEMRLLKKFDASKLPLIQRKILAQRMMGDLDRTLVTLAKDVDANVRSLVASNRKAPAEALEILASDRSNLSYKIREELVQHGNTSARALEILADVASGDKKDLRTLKGIVRHPNVTPSLLARLAQHKDPSVRRRLVESPASEDDEEDPPW